jgi:hypothetical protein
MSLMLAMISEKNERLAYSTRKRNNVVCQHATLPR